MTETSAKRFNYEFKPAPEGFAAQLDWVIGVDSFSNSLIQKLKFTPADNDLHQALAVAKRHPDFLKDIKAVWGRSVQFSSQNTQVIMGQPYNTIELGGFGLQKQKITNEVSGSFDPLDPIELPTAVNFAENHYGVTHTSVIDKGREVILGDAYSFTGAYTADQISKKVAANLFFANKMANLEKPPFIVPIPIAIGHYPSISNSKDEHAYFGIFMVPYDGKRTGNFHYFGDNVGLISEHGKKMIESTPYLARVLAFISNNYGLTHNQPHPSNFYVPEDLSSPIYLADFSTVYPLHSKKQEKARAHELTRMVVSVWNTLTSLYVNNQEDKVIPFLLKRIVEEYIGEHVPALVPSKVRLTEPFFSELFLILINSGTLPRTLPTEESWEKIKTLEKNIRNRIKKSASQ